MKRWVLPIVLLFLMVHTSQSQEIQPGDSLKTAFPATVAEDSLLITPTTEVSASLVMAKSPALAVGLSAVLPGAGQFYNESYWKIPIIAGLGGYFISEWISNDCKAEDYRVQYEESKTEDDPDGDLDLLATRDFYKQQRDSFVWYFVILYFANLIDAYVDANLYDFNVGEDLSLRLLPEFTTGRRESVGLGLKLTF